MKSFTWKLLICLLPVLIGLGVVARAEWQYHNHQGGFNLGVDLVGGTILVYEVDESKWTEQQRQDYSVQKLTAKLKQRIDPNDLYNVTIRPVSDTRIEIILPTGGAGQAEAEEANWNKLVEAVKTQWPPKEQDSAVYNVGLDQRQALIDAVAKEHIGDPNFKVEDVAKFIDAQMPAGAKRRSMTGEQVQKVKELISHQGSLQFVIVANRDDDTEAFEVAKQYFADVPNDPEKQKALKVAAVTGNRPPSPRPPDGKAFNTQLGLYTYTWIELGKGERITVHLDNAMENNTSPIADRDGHPTGIAHNAFWQMMAEARLKNNVVEWQRNLYFSRPVANPDRLPPEDRGKRFEYFVLTRDSERDADGKTHPLTGEYLTYAGSDTDDKHGLVVNFRFNGEGANLLSELTTKNKGRQMAIVLDDTVQSAPSIQTPLTGGGGIIYGNYTKDDVDRMVTMLRSGALPATLKPQPVSENTMGSTLGQDTVKWGTISVLVAFGAILLFMLIYYRFAGIVACIALFANLILTVALMVLISATFTLPGLAGLVLMLGMAVDANVLIYERLREERDRGASLALAIRNGYDRAFPVIIDTHLSSIFTAIVLYVVGNDQLKGFGISLTLGLIISLFTSLFVTRFLFDLWLSKGWLHKLSMMRILSKPNWDFMSIRYYWFTATIILTILGATVFFWRLDSGGLNIDFMGGTAYTGLLKKDDAMNITELRAALDLDNKDNKAKLAVSDVKKLDDKGDFELTYASDGAKREVFVNKYKDGSLPTEQKVQQRAEDLPDLSVVQIFKAGFYEGDKSQFFTMRTQEMSPDLVQSSITRLLGGKLKQTTMAEPKVADKGKSAQLEFSDYASPAQMEALIQREFARRPDLESFANQFTLERVGKDEEGRYKAMHLVLTGSGDVDEAKVKDALAAVQAQLADHPQPERLENFDSVLAGDTQMRALYAILASWGAILLYLWFRFGSWTFGGAAVLCLIHDLFFTLGFIGIAHYIHAWFPGLAHALLISDFKIDLQSVAALLTLVGYSVSDTIVVFDRIREVRGKNPELTPKVINDSVNQTLSRTLLTAASVWLVVIVLYAIGGEGVHLFAYVMVIGVIVGTYSSIYIASPLLLIFGEGKRREETQRQAVPQTAQA